MLTPLPTQVPMCKEEDQGGGGTLPCSPALRLSPRPPRPGWVSHLLLHRGSTSSCWGELTPFLVKNKFPIISAVLVPQDFGSDIPAPQLDLSFCAVSVEPSKPGHVPNPTWLRSHRALSSKPAASRSDVHPGVGQHVVQGPARDLEAQALSEATEALWTQCVSL